MIREVADLHHEHREEEWESGTWSTMTARRVLFTFLGSQSKTVPRRYVPTIIYIFRHVGMSLAVDNLRMARLRSSSYLM